MPARRRSRAAPAATTARRKSRAPWSASSLRAHATCRVCLSVRPSICLSVCLSIYPSAGNHIGQDCQLSISSRCSSLPPTILDLGCCAGSTQAALSVQAPPLMTPPSKQRSTRAQDAGLSVCPSPTFCDPIIKPGPQRPRVGPRDVKVDDRIRRIASQHPEWVVSLRTHWQQGSRCGNMDRHERADRLPHGVSRSHRHSVCLSIYLSIRPSHRFSRSHRQSACLSVCLSVRPTGFQGAIGSPGK
jgi:hypothetical protein